MLNKFIGIGNLGADPETKYMTNGNAVVNFTVATSESWVKDGEKQQKTNWHRCVVFGKLAEICGKYLHKGKQIYIEGKIQNRSYDDRDGNKRYISEVVVDQMQMLGSRDDNQSSGASGGGQSYNQGGQNQNQGAQNQNQGGQNQNQGAQNQNQNVQSTNSGQQQGGGFEEPVFNPDDEIPF
jgi:single-strand DNA-binding protein